MDSIKIEATHVSPNSGAYTLLHALLVRLEAMELKTIVYCSKSSVKKDLLKCGYSNIDLVKTNSVETLMRYFKKRTSVLFFMNVPPFRKNERSVLYFHNELILTEKSRTIQSFKYWIYRIWLRKFSKNIDFIACQTTNISQKLKNLTKSRVKKLPFYSLFTQEIFQNPKIYDFCYISSQALHKNHDRLLTAIDILSDEENFKILLTIPFEKKSKKILERISLINSKHRRTIIVNAGLLPREEVLNVYNQSKALIFPSLRESLGLPLIEAVESGLLVLSSDLPFSYEVLANPIVFDPECTECMVKVMRKYLNGDFKNTSQFTIIQNKLEDIINSIVYVQK